VVQVPECLMARRTWAGGPGAPLDPGRVDYAKERQQFGQAIGKNSRRIQHKLANSLIRA